MPLLGSKPKPKEAPKNNGDEVSPEQWIKNSGHSLKGIFLEWLSEQKLFDIVNGEIKRIKKENQKKKNMSPKDKLAWKRQAAKLSDETISKFGRDYLGKNSAEETKEYIRDGLNTVASQIKTGNFYKKASLFGDEDMDKFMEDLEAEWDEDEFSSSGEHFMFMAHGAIATNWMREHQKKERDNWVSKYKVLDSGWYMRKVKGNMLFMIKPKTNDSFPNHLVHDMEKKSGKIEEYLKKYMESEDFTKWFENEWKLVANERIKHFSEKNLAEHLKTYGFRWTGNSDVLKEDMLKEIKRMKHLVVYFKEGDHAIFVNFGNFGSDLIQGSNLHIALSYLGLESPAQESFRKPYREFMSVNDMGKDFDKGYDYKIEKNPNDGTYHYDVHIDTPFPGHFNVTIKNKDAERPSPVVKSILGNMDKIEALWRKYISTPKFKKEFESEWEAIKYTIDTEDDEWLENLESEMDIHGLVKDPSLLKEDLWKYATDPEDVWLYYNEGEDKIQVVFGYYLEYAQQGYDWEVKLKDIGIKTSKGESYFMKYKAMGEFSKGGSDKNVFTIGLGDIKRYEGLLKAYTSTKKSIRGFISKVIKLANKDINEAKVYANKNDVDSLLDKMSDADNNLLDEMSDLVKGKLEPKNLPTNVAKKMKSYLDKQHKVFTSYDIPEEVYNKWKEIYSSNENDPTMKAINNTVRFFEPNIVNGSDYTKIYDRFKDFKVSTPTPAAEMMYLTQRESVLSNDDIEELSNAIEKYNAMKREYGPKLLKVMHTVMNNKEDLDQGEITIDDFDLEEFSASDASYDLEKAIKNIDAINFDKSDYTTKERLRQEFKHLMDVCDFEVIPRSDSEKWKKFSEDNYSSKFSSQYPDIVEFIDRELSYVEKDFLASKEFKNIYKRVGEAKLHDIINKSPIGENFIKRLGGKR